MANQSGRRSFLTKLNLTDSHSRKTGNCQIKFELLHPKRGRVKRSKSRNLLERLRNFKEDVLRFMTVNLLPFTNNRAENDIRMTKVQQKISGCFRSIEGAYIFCRIRGYLLTCQKHGVTPTQALGLLFQGELPEFLKNELPSIS